MTEYEVTHGETITTVEAEDFEIEDGAVVFYEDSEGADTIGAMSLSEKVVAVKDWTKVERA